VSSLRRPILSDEGDEGYSTHVSEPAPATSSETGDAGTGIPAAVSLVEELGGEAYAYCQLAENATNSLTNVADIIVRVDPHTSPKIGDQVGLHVKDGSMLLFNAETGMRVDVLAPGDTNTTGRN
jgi:multiple sugar transport system ATP-binding protein